MKLTDFGIAQSLDDPRLTTSGMLIGSPTYMAPERLRGDEADPSSDLWALGAVLFYAVEGYSPFERTTTAATMHAIMSEVPFLTRCGGPLASVIMGLLVGSPQGRLGAAQVRGLLGQLNTGANPVIGDQTNRLNPGTALYAQPGAPGNGAPVAPRRPRRTVALVALCVVLAAALFAGGFFTKGAIEPDPSVDPVVGQLLTYGSGGDIEEFGLSSSGCASGQLGVGRSYPSTSSCDEAHDIEVFGTYEMFGITEVGYPNRARLDDYAHSSCAVLFESARVLDEKRGKLKYAMLVPTKESWEADASSDRDRRIYCLLTSLDGKQTAGTAVSDNS